MNWRSRSQTVVAAFRLTPLRAFSKNFIARRAQSPVEPVWDSRLSKVLLKRRGDVFKPRIDLTVAQPSHFICQSPSNPFFRRKTYDQGTSYSGCVDHRRRGANPPPA